ncbi:hypothetical protein BVC80_1289g61 [Macleaya cordata]|uniref:CLAVATA3/ESR (CLE)-related protein n=1 Tax=Macleaya cordata TaxID=56857 RepID=A0A200Q9L2_MACCD|nr:hypothetical protein BVC80_1289g61 [Macleaya cordata]
MAVRFIVLYLALTVALVLVFKNVSDCRIGYGGCIPEEEMSAPIHHSRKLLHDSTSSSSEEVFTSFPPLDQHGGPNVDGRDLRTVPSGPDPLHHHGGGPKKPQTP